jgi:hypothetical protein
MQRHRDGLKIAGAFAAIYLLWGGTYLAIALGVLDHADEASRLGERLPRRKPSTRCRVKSTADAAKGKSFVVILIFPVKVAWRARFPTGGLARAPGLSGSPFPFCASAMGQERRSRDDRGRSALLPTSDVRQAPPLQS